VQISSCFSPTPQGNTKNSHFQENAFVVWIDGVRQGAGGHNATFATSSQQSEQAYAFGKWTMLLPIYIPFFEAQKNDIL
jgi:hypothetical protein